MKIEIENQYLSSAYNFLYGLSLKGKLSRGRSKFLKLIFKKVKEFEEDQKEILHRYSDKDENGEAKKTEDGRFDINEENNILANKELNELMNEKVAIEYGEYVNNIQPLEEFLNEYDGELSGQDAAAFDAILDAFENKEEK